MQAQARVTRRLCLRLCVGFRAVSGQSHIDAIVVRTMAHSNRVQQQDGSLLKALTIGGKHMDFDRKPVREIRRGDVVATVWANRMIGRRDWYSVTFSRRYRKDRQWHFTSSLRYRDLMNLRRAARWAHIWIAWHGPWSARKFWWFWTSREFWLFWRR